MRASRCLARSVKTGHGACRSTPFVTLPNTARCHPVRACVAVTIISTRCALTAPRISATGSSILIFSSTLTCSQATDETTVVYHRSNFARASSRCASRDSPASARWATCCAENTQKRTSPMPRRRRASASPTCRSGPGSQPRQPCARAATFLARLRHGSTGGRCGARPYSCDPTPVGRAVPSRALRDGGGPATPPSHPGDARPRRLRMARSRRHSAAPLPPGRA